MKKTHYTFITRKWLLVQWQYKSLAVVDSRWERKTSVKAGCSVVCLSTLYLLRNEGMTILHYGPSLRYRGLRICLYHLDVKQPRSQGIQNISFQWGAEWIPGDEVGHNWLWFHPQLFFRYKLWAREGWWVIVYQTRDLNTFWKDKLNKSAVCA